MRSGNRIVLVGAPRSGKSTFARELRARGIPTLCTDPKSLVKDVERDVTYLPEIYAPPSMWSEGSRHVADSWMTRPGPWVIDGVGSVRALRKLLDDGRMSLVEGFRIVRFTGQYAHAVTKPGQVTMAKAIDTIWDQIADRLRPITEYK